MINKEDPRLTAYALGEMDDGERAGFEKELANDPAARAEVDAIRALGGRLSSELEHSAAPVLTDAQRSSVARAARRRVPLAVLLMPLAACLLAAVWLLSRSEDPESIARRESALQTEPVSLEEDRPHLIDGRANDDRNPFAPKDSHGTTPAESVSPLAGTNYATPSGEAPSDTPPKPEERERAAAPNERKPTDPEPPPAPPGDPGDEGGTTVGTVVGERILVVNGAEGKAPAATPAPAPGVRLDGVSDGKARRAIAGKKAKAALEGVEGARTYESRAEAIRRFERDSAGGEPFNREAYDRIVDNPFIRVSEENSSTFSIDVDTASYANVRRFLMQEHRLPPRDAVRIEEMVNYFSYPYEPPAAGSPDPFRIHVEVAQCPWDTTHRLARVAIKGKVIDHRERPASNLVFLVDVSGSMNHPNKLPLVQASLRLLAENLGERDRVAIVVYAGAAGLVLPSTGDKRQVIEAIDRLRAGGSTAGAAGIQLAYQVAADNFLKEGTNRVILCTDGDFNVGISDAGALTRLIEEKAKTGVFLSVLGFGTGNYQDARMQQLADKGNGNHAYIDSILEARKVLGEEMSGTLVTIAKDVKIQIFFNPKQVAGFRLIGYENRLLSKQDFNDDTKDAGEIGAGHSVTALYELVPAGGEVPGAPPPADENPFVKKAVADPSETDLSESTVDPEALFQLRLRYKQPDGDTSKLIETMVHDGEAGFDAASPDFRWAGAVAAFGMNLRGNAGMGLDAVLEIAKGTAGDDKYRHEFLQLVETAKLLTR